MKTLITIIVAVLLVYFTLPTVVTVSAAVGLVVGYVLPQPQIVRDLWDKHIAPLFDDA